MANHGLCSVEDCGKAARPGRKVLCSMHEARLRRGGTLDRRVARFTVEMLLKGQTRFGMWTVLGESEPYQRPAPTGRKHPDGQIRTAHCQCDCGELRTVPVHTLTQGHSRHCGCRVSEMTTAQKTIHGLSRTVEHSTWSRMKQRCANPRSKDYPDYGGRGISVCERWQNSFEAFYADMGKRPPGTSIDRIDVNGDYEPGNCRWADAMTQRHNRRI